MGLKLSVNEASASELVAIPGVGPATARHIVAGRPYEGMGDLVRARGIGPKRLKALRRYLRP